MVHALHYKKCIPSSHLLRRKKWIDTSEVTLCYQTSCSDSNLMFGRIYIRLDIWWMSMVMVGVDVFIDWWAPEVPYSKGISHILVYKLPKLTDIQSLINIWITFPNLDSCDSTIFPEWYENIHKWFFPWYIQIFALTSLGFFLPPGTLIVSSPGTSE